MHCIGEAELLCQWVAIMDERWIIALETAQNLIILGASTTVGEIHDPWRASRMGLGFRRRLLSIGGVEK
jgi:hypothetical protein